MEIFKTLDDILLTLSKITLNTTSENQDFPIQNPNNKKGIFLKDVFEMLKIPFTVPVLHFCETKLIDDGYIEYVHKDFNLISISHKGIVFILEKGGYKNQLITEKENERRRMLEDKILRINANAYVWNVVSIIITVSLSLLTIYLTFIK